MGTRPVPGRADGCPATAGGHGASLVQGFLFDLLILDPVVVSNPFQFRVVLEELPVGLLELLNEGLELCSLGTLQDALDFT